MVSVINKIARVLLNLTEPILHVHSNLFFNSSNDFLGGVVLNKPSVGIRYLSSLDTSKDRSRILPRA